MYLKKVEMRGFKSFADRTELEFGPGITAIVGPNGTGKSNVADAILWALGEQSHRSLRTETSQDVIFSGSERRRPLGMAEVALTIDNSDGRLGVDFSEVIIARRLFRSGESEYLLNRASVRLRDVRDVLLDTGIGPGSYSVIGQGEIDAVLSIRSEDRRELLEEVAGIRKYRVRRDEATRKLEATQANMTRVADIVAELASQREPLQAQAEVARQYKDLAERLRELELHVLAIDYTRRRARIGRLAHELEITRADLQSTRNQLSLLEAEYEQLQFELARVGDEVDRLRDEAAAAERALDQARQAQALADERMRAAEARRADLLVMLEGQRRRSQELAEQHRQTVAEHQACAAELEAALQERRRLEAALQEKAEALRVKQERVAELERAQKEALDRAKALENEALALHSLEADLAERATRLCRQAEALAARQRELAASLESGAEAQRLLEAKLEEGRTRLAELRASLGRVTVWLHEHRQKCNVFSSAVTHAEARQGLLRELEQAREGFSDGARAAVRAAAEGQIRGVLGIVADLLEVPAKLERAVEAALGEALQWVVTETEEQALEAARAMKTLGAGRVTFLPLGGPLMPPTPVVAPSHPGCLGPLLKLVRFRRQYEGVFSRLIGSTLVVRDLETALDCLRRLPSRYRLVTLAGEVVDPSGALTVGGEEGPGTQAFLRRRELQELSRELRVMREYLARMWEREEELDREVRQRTDEIHGLESELSQLQSTHAAAAAELSHLAEQETAARQMSRELAQEAESINQRLEEAREKREAAEAESQALRERAAEIGQQLDQMRHSGVGQAEVEALRAQHVAAQVRAAELAEKERSLAHLVQRFEGDLARTAQEIAAAEAELEASTRVAEELRRELQAPGVDLLALERQAGESRAAVTHGSQQLSALREKSAELDSMRGRLARVVEEQTDRIHRAELGLAREEAQLETVAERLEDTYGLSPEQAIAERGEELDERQVQREANELREKIRALGPVNLSAIEECDRLLAREEFLSAQLEDLRAAREDLLEVIREIDEAATQEFLSAFARVQEEFQVMFSRLFGGGQTELRLSNPEKPLDAGVDVMVQVPGKRQQNLLLLSGGERALTALALLFAMLRVKPTPFCVLDEIDAALDEANVGRFTEILGDFARNTQFIIITHNPHTIQAADVLFGVTMEEPGVSTLIKLEMRQWEEFLSEEERRTATFRGPRAGTRVLPSHL